MSTPLHGVHGEDAADLATPSRPEIKMCRHCQITMPSKKQLKLLQEKWHGLVCSYCYQRRGHLHVNIRQMSLTRRIEVETWLVAKLLHKRAKKPKGKFLCAKPETMFAGGMISIAFAGQLMRTKSAASDAQLTHLLEPLSSHMQELGL